ncbi:MAG TPA: methionine ABC transporter permease, partial [Firmicutes bacterium]|nr:methionine ABC transporter permease [Bacillota bacterium]
MLFRLLWTALLETVWMVAMAGVISIVLGTVVGAALVFFSDPGLGRDWPINRVLHIEQVLSAIVNVGRSVPFLVLMVAIIPLTRLLVGT